MAQNPGSADSARENDKGRDTAALEELMERVPEPESFSAFLKEQGIEVEGTKSRKKRFLDNLPAYRYVRWEPKGVPVAGAAVEVPTCEGKLYMFLTKEAFDASFG